MLDQPDLQRHFVDARWNPQPPAPTHYLGPERRSHGPVEPRQLLQTIDEVDYGMLLLGDEGRVLQMNKVARRDLAGPHPLKLVGRHLHTRDPQELALLRAAVDGAARRGLRQLLHLGGESGGVGVAVVPLPQADRELRHPVLLMLGRRRVCEPLTVEWFARSQGLTMAETVVLKGLCADLTPLQIAERQGVGMATVRTQIGSIRTKTGTGSIAALVRQLALLPPMVSALQDLVDDLDPMGLGAAADRATGRRRPLDS
ncbi:LuxR family transcriptional regulator [Ideonella sp. A 288]|uniref:helix-turn-helix transcriptional regulator n=1 Tax=Ideonella sp. A 288 TaxID=1962181 RepID=UPI000B4BEF0D|nr:LuxR family transcriptional regulator [Ideonella sp. A 288]